jgi:GTP cyclohydrolase II
MPLHDSLSSHIILTSHPSQQIVHSTPIHWGANTASERGPIIATLTTPSMRNAIGTHGGVYSIYRALAATAGRLPGEFVPDLTNTAPAERIGPYPVWANAEKIVALDPWGADVFTEFKDYLAKGFDIRPSIAVTKAHINMPEIKDAITAGRIKVDGTIIGSHGDASVTKVALEPVWYLPGIAERFGISEGTLRKGLFRYTGGMFPELVTRHDLKIFLPPIGSATAYIFGPVANIADLSKELTVRVHDECNGSDVFGSDICTCRPYLAHGIEEAIKTAQHGGSGLIIYYRKEGRALGEVTKFLVYNARKRHVDGDSAAEYFHRTECVAGVQDMRFQQLMPDALHWFGINRIDNFVSMSDMKYDAIIKSGIKIVNRVPIPDDLIPDDARVEMAAKKSAGYYSPEKSISKEELKDVRGRKLDE